MTQENGHNGWKNHATWNVALWINNHEGFYNFAKDLSDYATFQDSMGKAGMLETPDRVNFNDSSLDVESLDELILNIS